MDLVEALAAEALGAGDGSGMSISPLDQNVTRASCAGSKELVTLECDNSAGLSSRDSTFF
jgi:hypothetical protein